MTRSELGRALLSLLAPNRCPFCGGIVGAFEYWHERCYIALREYDGAEPVPEGLSALTAPYVYEGAVRAALLRYKGGPLGCYAEPFALIMAEHIGRVQADVLVPVPSRFSSTLERGFQPAVRLARRLSRVCGVRCVSALGVRDGAEQKRLRAQARRENAGGAFFVRRPKTVAGKRVLLIDDICTTGSTLSACARILREAGAADVDGAVFAKTLSSRK